MEESKEYIFLSGANITSGGPLEIYRNILEIFGNDYQTKNIIAIVSDKTLFKSYSNIYFIEIKNYKAFIFLKFYYEYIKYLAISKQYNISLWFSINDCSPTVRAKKKAVYCHNPAPFYKRTLNDFLKPSRTFLQSFYYNLFYRINLMGNNFVIVQQNWIKNYFLDKFKVPAEKVIVSPVNDKQVIVKSNIRVASDTFSFIYPTKAAPYKNLEVILDAVGILNKSNLKNKFKFILTASGDENKHAKRLFEKYGNVKNVDWIGFIDRNKLEEIYQKSDCLIFSSKLETWGLPITEFKAYNKPMLISDLPYAKESAGEYSFVKFFNPNNPNDLYKMMLDLIEGQKITFDKTKKNDPMPPFINGIGNLIKFLVEI